MCGQITIQSQLLAIRDKNSQTCLQIFANLIQYLKNFKFSLQIIANLTLKLN